MGTLLPAISLAIVHIAGDNAGVVPDAAALCGADIYIVTVIAYMVIGVLISALCAWVGACSGFELGVLVRRQYGCPGKKLLAVAILVVSIPASALTGGYFCGWLVHGLTGLPQPLAALLCLAVFTLLAAGNWDELLAVSGYGSLLMVPMVLVLFLAGDTTAALPERPAGNIDWLLVLALASYNSGGMRPLLVTEAAAYLMKRGRRAVLLAIAAKALEGIITVIMAQVVISAGAHGPLALSAAAEKLLGPAGGILFDCSLLCVFLNTMVPAMMVNARQTASLTGLKFWPSLLAAGAAVCLIAQLDYKGVLTIMSGAGVLMVGVVAYTACQLHKQKVGLKDNKPFQSRTMIIEKPENIS
ncbi:MAG: hypothetical protein P4N41_25065 [Negativicutes bacterium]|nr:hypothetical protein [Negativicutes bacterium]